VDLMLHASVAVACVVAGAGGAVVSRAGVLVAGRVVEVVRGCEESS
jgi:hypothetical protein